MSTIHNVDLSTRKQAFALRVVMWLQTALTIIGVGIAGAIVVLAVTAHEPRQTLQPVPHDMPFTI